MADAKKQEATYVPRLRKDYDDRIVKAMTEKFGYKNAMQVPKLDKIVINMGVGGAVVYGKCSKSLRSLSRPLARLFALR